MGEKERERNINWLVASYMHPNLPQTGTEPATQACPLTWNLTSEFWLCGTMPDQLSHASWGYLI